MLRTHTCGELTNKEIGKNVELAGWAHTRRDHGGIIFIDLRDRYGITQAVFDPKHNKETHKLAESIGREWVLHIFGKVRARPKGMENPNMKTGLVEVLADKLEIICKSKVPPIEIEDRTEAKEDLRLKYRYLDLRRPIMQQRLIMRHNLTQAARDYFSKNGFLEIETPLMVRSTPEGARDYIVPSRVSPGKFYALPQSPQLYKQTLMISGFDRYYQIARCLRDEDLRADRQPEHTQMDLEMSFVSEKDIMDFVEGLYKHLVKEATGKKLEGKFPTFSYEEAMERYGCDKPDLRFGMELADVTDIVKKSEFNVFTQAETVKVINAEKEMTRTEIENLTEFAVQEGAKGLAWMKIEGEKLEGSIAKYFNTQLQKELLKKTKAKKGILFFAAGKKKHANEILSKIRNKLGKEHGLIKERELKFCWVTDFPLFEWNAEEEKWDAMHHIFSSPKPEYIKYLESDPGKVLGNLFDIVLNGTELGSGSIRISNPELQERAMKVIGMNKEEARNKFGFLLEAYEYGGPVHGGMGLGLDRFVALIQGLNDIREVIAFPKNKKAECPMDGCPNDVEEKQLKELHIKTDVGKK